MQQLSPHFTELLWRKCTERPQSSIRFLHAKILHNSIDYTTTKI